MKALVAALFATVVSAIASSFAADVEPLVVAQVKTELIDINRAKAEELMTLKGIGEARATAIIKGRPYARKDELVQKKIIPESVYNASTKGARALRLWSATSRARLHSESDLRASVQFSGHSASGAGLLPSVNNKLQAIVRSRS